MPMPCVHWLATATIISHGKNNSTDVISTKLLDILFQTYQINIPLKRVFYFRMLTYF